MTHFVNRPIKCSSFVSGYLYVLPWSNRTCNPDVTPRVGNERARSSSGENERKDFRAKSSSGENERKDFRAEPSSGERIFERVRVRAMLEHVSSKIRASSLTNFGQIRACFSFDFSRCEQYFKHKLLQRKNEKMEMAFVWALSRFLAEKIHNHKFKCWLTQILAIFSSNLAFFKSVMIF